MMMGWEMVEVGLKVEVEVGGEMMEEIKAAMIGRMKKMEDTANGKEVKGKAAHGE